MRLSEFKTSLSNLTEINFFIENGEKVPEHFHITEVGEMIKNFIDCGGTLRSERKVCMQLWTSDDFNHRLSPVKLLSIIELSEKKLQLRDEEIVIEFQTSTVSNYGLDFEDGNFILRATITDCLAKDKCGIPLVKPKIKLSELSKTNDKNTCKPGGKCC